ncbi:putative MFS monosaccharide transporter [Pseudohyphozyma bogoriensis]|nr:putative MFS monosaccharide transporter [Pseudohyphozyma bogoriensis]
MAATNEKAPAPNHADADAPPSGSGLELTTSLPADAKTNAAGVPSYLGLTGNKLIMAITVTATTGFLLFGYDQGVMSGLITGQQFIQTFPACDAAVQGDYKASILQATYTSIYELGCLVGAIFSLFFGNKLGRRRIMQMGAVVMIIGVAIQVSSVKGYHAGVQFCVGRVITGVGNGMNTATIPSWVAETSKSHNRGMLVCIEASMIATGTMIAYWVDYGLSFVKTSLNWRLPIALQVVFAVLLLIGVYFLPESPRWLMHEGRHIDAQRVIAALTDDTYDSEATLLQTRLIMQAIEQSHQLGVVKKRNMFTNGPTQHFRRMLLGASSQIFQQIGGCNAVIYFAPVIYKQNLGLSENLSLILGGVNVTVYALAACGSYFAIESLGRRKMFLIGSIGQTVSLLIVAFCYLPNTHQSLKGSVFGMFLFLTFFGATWLELPWLYPAEINPLRTRTNANAVSTISNWLFNFAVVQWTPPMLDSLKWGTFLFFAVINAISIPMIWFFYVETAGRTLEEVDLIFAKGFAGKESYVHVSTTMPRYDDKAVQIESERLHLEHLAKKRLVAEEAIDGTDVAQGFKSKAPKAAKASSSTSKKLKPKDPKKGARVIAPKKEAAVARAVIHKKNTSSHASMLEKTIATQAISKGKLTIMRGVADETDEGRKAVLAKK